MDATARTFKLRQAVLFEGKPQAWRAVTPAWSGAFPIPSMVCDDELQLLHYLARDHYSGQGAIVDCGPLAGGSTFALASGANGRGVVHSYDLWTFFPGWEQFFPHRRFATGDDILPEFEAYVAPYRHMIQVHKGDLRQHHWTTEPIELMFIDAAKSPPLMHHLVSDFFPHLANGAVVIHQDYVCAECPWIHVAAVLLEDYFEWMDSPFGGSVCARLRRPIPVDALPADYYDALSVEAGCRLLDRAADVCVGWERLCIVLAKANFLVARHHAAEARETVRRVTEDPDFMERYVGYDVRLIDRQLATASAC